MGDPLEQRLWTLQISGPAFSFQSAGNPSVVHDGGTTVDHLVLTAPEVGELKVYAAAAGCKVKAWPMEGQNAHQKAHRDRWMGLAGKEHVWPTPECPMCPWFDPLHLFETPHGYKEACGIRTLPEESANILLLTSDSHIQAKEACKRADR